jgi:hypothetical protein
VLSLLSGAHASLAANTARHCAGLPAQHAVVCGPPGSGKSWLLWEGSLLAGEAWVAGGVTALACFCAGTLLLCA